MSDPQTLSPARTATAETARIVAVPLAIAPRAPAGDGLVAGGWDEDPGDAVHGHSLDALLAGGAPVAFVLGARTASDAALSPVNGARADPLSDSAVRPMLLGNSALLVEAAPTLAPR